MNETNLIAKADIKVDPEEFCQANYEGMRWIIICSSTLLMYFFYCCFYDLFQDYISIPVKYRFLYSTVFNVFFRAEEMTSVSNEIYLKEEASCSSLESDQVCSILCDPLIYSFGNGSFLRVQNMSTLLCQLYSFKKKGRVFVLPKTF